MQRCGEGLSNRTCHSAHHTSQFIRMYCTVRMVCRPAPFVKAQALRSLTANVLMIPSAPNPEPALLVRQTELCGSVGVNQR